MITKVRPRVSSGAVLVETRGLGAGLAAGAAGTENDSKLTTVCGLPSSLICSSFSVRSVRGTPFLSVTTTSTVTCSTPAGKVTVTSGVGVGFGSGRCVWLDGAGGGGSVWGIPGAGMSIEMSANARNLWIMAYWTFTNTCPSSIRVG